MDDKQFRRLCWGLSLLCLLALGTGLLLRPSGTSSHLPLTRQDTVIQAKKKRTITVHLTDTVHIKRPVILAYPEPEPLYATVDMDPEFPGGYDALKAYIQDYLEYPETDREYGLEYTGTLTLNIDRSGKVTGIEMIPLPTKDLQYSLVQFSRKMPRFKPAMRYSRPVASRVKIPLSFKFTD